MRKSILKHLATIALAVTSVAMISTSAYALDTAHPDDAPPPAEIEAELDPTPDIPSTIITEPITEPSQVAPPAEADGLTDLMRILLDQTQQEPEPEPIPHVYHTLERATGLFDYPGGTMHGAVSPQDVRILDTYGDYWKQISTWQGPMWIYENFTPPTYGLNNLLSRHGNLGVFFYNIETGFTYTFNGNREFFGASVSKASYALYLYQRAERGEIDLNRMITYTGADFNGGSGVIRTRYRQGQSFTTRRVIALNLYQSDNIATNMLRRTFGLEGYRQFVASLGGNPNLVRNRIFNSQLTANEAGRFAQAIWEYTQSGGRYSQEFMDALLNNQFQFLVSDYPIASKTGWTSPIAWHDMAIIQAPSPYILVVLSARGGWSARDYAAFAEISHAFQDFNARWFYTREQRTP